MALFRMRLAAVNIEQAIHNVEHPCGQEERGGIEAMELEMYAADGEHKPDDRYRGCIQ